MCHRFSVNLYMCIHKCWDLWAIPVMGVYGDLFAHGDAIPLQQGLVLFELIVWVINVECRRKV